jgi:hypothetical protein
MRQLVCTAHHVSTLRANQAFKTETAPASNTDAVWRAIKA